MDEDVWEKMAAFRREAAKIDTSSFSPSLQQAIREFEQSLLEHETDLQYLRRTKPNLTEAQRIYLMHLSAIAGIPLRQQNVSQEEIA